MYLELVSVQKLKKKKKSLLIEGFVSLKILVMTLVIIIFKAVCEDEKNISITDSKTTSLWYECHLLPLI